MTYCILVIKMVVEKRLDFQYSRLVSEMETKRTVVLKHLSSTRNEEISFGRFLRNPRVSMHTILSEITSKTSQLVKAKSLLLIEDSTELSFGLDSQIKNIGKVGTGKEDGFYSHPVVVLDTQEQHCYGLAHCHIYNQNHKNKDAGYSLKERIRLNNHTRFDQKDSYRWLSSIIEAKKVCQSSASMTVVADREADIYEALEYFIEKLSIDFLIRMRVDRPVVGEGENQKIVDTLAKVAYQKSYKIMLPATDKRSKDEAQLMVKWKELSIKKPKNNNDKTIASSIKINVIQVSENPDTVVNNEEPIHWILLTSHPVESFEDAYQIIQWYTWRWFIEQLFRLLKSQGLNMEHSTLTTYESLSKLSLLALDVAIKILQLVMAKDVANPTDITNVFSEDEVEFIKILAPTLEGKTDKLKNPYKNDDLRFAIWVIARLAGWSGYQKQSPPGPITLHRGMVIFKQLFRGFIITKSICQRTSS